MEEKNLNIPDIFSNVVTKIPQNIALQVKRDAHWQRFTYRDLENCALKVATFLVKEGYKGRDFAAIVLENRPEWAIIYLGLMCAGLSCVPLDPQTSPEDLRNLIIDSTAKIIFCSYDIFIKKINQNIQEPSIKIILLDAREPSSKNLINFSDVEQVLPDKNAISHISHSPEDIASLIYTSGTTAHPKGVLLSHKNICSNFKSIAKLNICFPSDNFISFLPLHHTYPFMITLILPIFLGAKITYVLSLKPQEMINIIREANVTILVGVPQFFSLVHKAIFERIKRIPRLFLPLISLFLKIKLRRQFGCSLRLLVSGGARLAPRIAKDLSHLLGIKFSEGYGLTETSPAVTLNPPQKIKFGSVGKAIPSVEIKILNPDANGIGQVLIKGENVMQGYFKQPGLTDEVIKEGWFYSGDLGYIDNEGYLFLVGREKEVIVLSSGKNIYPEELEEYYSRSPYIKEICILSWLEEKFGHPVESLHAIVVPNLEYFKLKNETDIQGKIRWELENLSKPLPSYKHIMGFTITKEELPRTALKKIKRYQVRDKYFAEKPLRLDVKEGLTQEEALDIANKDIAKKIINYISSELKKPVYLDSHLEIDLGIDSLSRVELGLGLERLLKLKIPDELILTVSTIREVIEGIRDAIDKSKPVTYQTKTMPENWNQILRDYPDKAILNKLRLTPGFLDKLITWIFKIPLSFIFRVFWLLKIKGRRSLPTCGPYILCPNHASYLDGFVIFSSLPFGSTINLFFLGYSAILESPLVSWASKIARLVSIDPNIHLTQSMQAASFLLSQKKIVCIFPEGRRSIDESIGEFKKGVGILAKELNVPVIPVYIKGSHKSWPRTSHLPRFHPLKIIFSRAFTAKELLEKVKGEPIFNDYEGIAKSLRKEVIRLAC